MNNVTLMGQITHIKPGKNNYVSFILHTNMSCAFPIHYFAKNEDQINELNEKDGYMITGHLEQHCYEDKWSIRIIADEIRVLEA